MKNEIAERYGSGLFELAKETNTVESKKDQAEELLRVVSTTGDLLLFLRAVKITKEEKKEFTDRVFKDALDHDMRSFLKLLIDKDRTYYLKDILEEYVNHAYDYLGIERATVFSARELNETDLARIREALEKKLKKKVILKNMVDPKVIAGIKVKVGNTVTDVTMASRIENMKQALLKGGQA